MGVVSELYVAQFDSDTFSALLSSATSALEKAGADFVKAAFSDRWARRRALEIGYIQPTTVSSRFSDIGPMLMLAGTGQLPLLHQVENWWLTRGDSEQDWTDTA